MTNPALPPAAPSAGIAPWLPWPLSAWSCWSTPIRAERLAALRIGVALCLIFDIAYNYAPDTLAFFGKGGLGDPAVFTWKFEGPRADWSLLRGVGDPTILTLSLLCWITTSIWIFGNGVARLLLVHKNPPIDDRTGLAMTLWTVACCAYAAGLWSQMIGDTRVALAAWLIPLLGFIFVCLVGVLDVVTRLRDPSHAIPWIRLTIALVASLTMTSIGMAVACLDNVKELDKSLWWVRLLGPWQEVDALVITCMALWIVLAALLLLGVLTRYTSIATWMISMSFANANEYLDNAGDTIRLTLLFYLMLCPCAAAWSLDSLCNRWRSRRSPLAPHPSPLTPRHVHPWPVCLIFVQMIFIYFMNGLYKLVGARWRDGAALYFVLGDLALTRVSPASLPLTVELSRIMTWTVLAWEVTFPLLVIFKWPRRIALAFGIMFHIGIFTTMELGGFVPYALCMYVPLLPWETLCTLWPFHRGHHDSGDGASCGA